MKIVIAALIALMVFLFIPTTDSVIIVKSRISSNKLFAGRINDQVVGSEICSAYWLQINDQPDSVRVDVCKPYGMGLLGYIYTTKITKL